MAIKWGSTVNVGGGIRQRIGIEAKVSYPGGTLDKTDTQATISGDVYVQFTNGWGQDQATWSTSGISGSGSVYYQTTSTGQTYKLGSFSGTRSLIYGSSQSVTVTASLNNVALPDPPNVSQTVTVGARPYQSPAVQTGLTVSRYSDLRQNLSWTRNATSSAPYSSQDIWRSDDGGTYRKIATVSGTATSYSDATTSTNHRYTYRLRAINSSGSSSYSGTDSISTTPTKPPAPTALKLPNGDIRVVRPALSPVASQWQVHEVGGPVLATLSKSEIGWTHSSPDPGATHTYQIRAVSSDPVLTSTWSWDSNTVQLITAPAAPTNLSPNGAVRDMVDPLILEWKHNSLDSSEQTAFQIRHRRAGGPWVTSPKVSSVDEDEIWVSGLYENGGADIEWEVRTWGVATSGGSDGTGASPWSATATIKPYAIPVAGTLDPDGSTAISLPSHLFEWSFFQAQGLTQSQWNLEIYQNNDLIASQNGYGTGTTWQSPAIFEDGNSYTWRVRVRDSEGVWSWWTPYEEFSATFVPPNPPIAISEWNRDGYVRLNLEAVNDGISPDTVSLTIRRSIDGGDWITLAEGLPSPIEYLDWTATVAGENCYQITAVTEIGATSTITECITVSGAEDCDRDVYIGGGPNLGTVVRFGLSDAVSVTTGRQRVLNEYDGRPDPVETSGLSVPYSVNIKAKIPPPVECGDLGVSDPRLIERIFHLPGPHLYRDWTGRHMFVSLSNLQYDEQYLGDVSFSVRRSDGGTEAQRSAIGAYVGQYLVQSPDGGYRITGGTMVETSPGEWTWTP